MTRRMDLVRRSICSRTLEADAGIRDCVWSPYAGGRPQRTYVEWRPITQPSLPATILDDVNVIEMPREVDLQILSAVDGQPYRFSYNYTWAEYVAGAADTTTTVRDALLASVNADLDPVSATVVGADTMRLTASTPGGLWRTRAPDEFFDVIAGGAAPLDIFELQRSMLRFTASMNVYASETSSNADSSHYAHEVESSFRSRRVTALFNREHMALTKVAEPVNLDEAEVGGSKIESRTAVDFEISFPYWRSEVIDTIESTEITITTDRGSIQIGA